MELSVIAFLILGIKAMTNKVFISYAWNDRHLVEAMLEKLKQARIPGLELASELEDLILVAQTGDDLRTMIRDRVESANQVVVLWTEQAAASQFVQYELGIADALDKPIIVVQADQSAPEFPAFLAKTNVVKLRDFVA